MVLQEQHQLKKIQQGDINSFEKLFHRFYPGLCGYGESLVGQGEIAEEVVQDVFYNVWKNRESLRITKSWQSYLYRAVYNNSMMYLRRMRRENPSADWTASEAEMDAPDPSQLMQFNEMSELVSRTLEAMPDRTREIFLLNRQEGLKYREIADRLSISVKTVEANMGKALKALRNSMEKYEHQ